MVGSIAVSVRPVKRASAEAEARITNAPARLGCALEAAAHIAPIEPTIPPFECPKPSLATGEEIATRHSSAMPFAVFFADGTNVRQVSRVEKSVRSTPECTLATSTGCVCRVPGTVRLLIIRFFLFVFWCNRPITR